MERNIMFQMICENNSRPLNSFPAHAHAAPLTALSSRPRWQFKRMFQRRQTTLMTLNDFKPLREQPIDQFKSIQYWSFPHYSCFLSMQAWGFYSTSNEFLNDLLPWWGRWQVRGVACQVFWWGSHPPSGYEGQAGGCWLWVRAVLSRLASEALNMSATRFLWRLDFPCPWTSSSFWHSILSLNAWERERDREREKERVQI